MVGEKAISELSLGAKPWEVSVCTWLCLDRMKGMNQVTCGRLGVRRCS